MLRVAQTLNHSVYADQLVEQSVNLTNWVNEILGGVWAHQVKKKILIIVENIPVPFDTRVWNEARSLQTNGYDVTVLCPRARGCSAPYELLEGVHIYRHPTAKEGNSPFGYLFE